MSNKKIKAIIFDIWGTILENGVYPSPLKQSKNILDLLKMPYSEFVVRFEKVFMTSKFKDIKEGLDMVFKEFNVNPNEYNRIDRLVGLWNKAKILSRLYPNTKKTLKDLKKDYKLIVLSNLSSTQSDIVQRYNLKDFFDDIFFSYEIEEIKSEGGFDKILSITGYSPNELIMVGDSMESDIKAAEKAGIKAILVDRRDMRDYDNKITTLKDLQKKIKEIENDK